MILCNQETPIMACEREKKTRFLSNVFAVLMGIFFVPAIVLYIIKPECTASLVLAITALLPMGCFIYFSTDHCGLRDWRHKRNVEILKLEIGKLELLPSDILGVKILGLDSEEYRRELMKCMKWLLPKGVKAFIYYDDLELGIIREKVAK